MATAQMHLQQAKPAGRGEPGTDLVRARAALRLLEVERSEEIPGVLLEEIVGLGFSRALYAEVDFESGQVRPSVSIGCSRQLQQRFVTSLYAADHPVVNVLRSLEPSLLENGPGPRRFYLYPLVFRSINPCWESQRESRPDCLAVENLQHPRGLRLPDQVCRICDMRGFGAVVAVDLGRQQPAAAIGPLRALMEVTNILLSRRFKVEHYFNRMREMDTAIGQLRMVMESMPDPVILTDNQHRVILQNRSAERFFKLPEQVSEGRARAVELNNLLFSAMLSSLAMGSTEASRDLTLIDAIEGEEAMFEAVSAPTLGGDGRRTGMITVMRDVGDLRRADQELRANYERLRATEEAARQERDRLGLIIETVGDPIVVCDQGARPVLMDRLAQRLLGPTDAAASDPATLQNRAKFDAYITAFSFSFTDRQSGKLQLYNPDSESEVEYDVRSGKIYDQRGQLAYTVSVLHDLTAVRKLEQLRLERRMLEIEKFAAIGRLAGTLAHEVNNPLEAIKNCAYLLQDRVQPDAQPVMEMLRSETGRVVRIVRQMLGLYRDSGQVGNVELNAVVEEVVQLYTQQLDRKRIRLESKLKPVPVLVGSSDQFRHVLSNLVVNAMDSMEPGGRLLMRTREVRAADGGRLARVLVADTGQGIPREMLESVFEPFVSTKGERGTGLGLWIVRSLVGNHGGKIRVRSRTGKGTVFKIDFPVVRP